MYEDANITHAPENEHFTEQEGKKGNVIKTSSIPIRSEGVKGIV